MANNDSSITSMIQTINYENVTLKEELIPSGGAGETFEVKGKYSFDGRATTKSYTVSTENPLTIQVPKGVTAAFVQTEKTGYKFKEYQAESDTITTPQSSSDMAAGQAVVINDSSLIYTIRNINQNYAHHFIVEWRDNRNAQRKRPEQSTVSYQLLCKIGDEDWAAAADNLERLGLSAAPTRKTINSNVGEYAFEGLPSGLEDGTPILYKIEQAAVNAYQTEYDNSGTQQKIINTLETSFSATVKWLDSGRNRETIQSSRLTPEEYVRNLHLYRFVRESEYEEITSVDFPFTQTDTNVWRLKIDHLPRYDSANNEYAYVLIYGTVDDAGTIIHQEVAGYDTYYNNGTSTYANNTRECFNNGVISNVLSERTTFVAHKKWKDDEGSVRPTDSVITLWRYSSTGNEQSDIEKATPVIYYGNDAAANDGGVLLSYRLGTTDSDIVFDHSTIEALPEGFRLPKFDEQGNLYVYFVKEITGKYVSEGVLSDIYEPTYSTDETGNNVLRYGALNGGYVNNIRKDKVRVTVTKIWRTTSEASDINNISVRVGLQAPVRGETNKKDMEIMSKESNVYTTLTGDAEVSETTLFGFSTDVVKQQITFYVNRYDKDGNPLDLSNATVVERAIQKESTDVQITDQTFNINGHDYKALSRYDSEASDPSNNAYAYTIVNALTGKKDFTIIKKWNMEHSDVTGVMCTVTGYSEDPDRTEAYYSNTNIVITENNNKWETVLRDLDAYDENGYAITYSAEETGFVLDDGSEMTLSEASRDRRWYVLYERSDDKNIMNNYESGNKPVYWMHFQKEWKDGGDVSSRPSVVIRVYKKSDLAGITGASQLNNVLQNKSIRQDTLTKNNVWFRNWSWKQENAAYTPNDLITLEYALQSDGQTYRVNYDSKWQDIKALANTQDTVVAAYIANQITEGVTVSTNNRKYKVQSSVMYSNSAGTVKNNTFVNTREGLVDIQIRKTWKDGYDTDDADLRRPTTLKFRLLRNDQMIPENDSIFTEIEGIEKDYEEGAYVGAKITLSTADAKTGTESNIWERTIHNLPKFTSTGVLNTYSVEEAETIGRNYVAESSTLTRRSIARGQDVDHDEYDYAFSNKKEKTVSIVSTIQWKDKALSPSSRPDAKMKLYRYATNHEGQTIDFEDVTDQTTQVWTDAASEGGTNYDWKVTATDLPGYDSDGFKYEYFFQEILNNGGETTEGNYVTTVEDHHREEVVPPSVTDIDSTQIAFDQEKIVNTITSEMIYIGTKTWSNMQWDYEEADLPIPVITLWRKKTVENGGISQVVEEKVASLKLTRSRYEFKFPDDINLNDANAPLETEADKNAYLQTLTDRGLLTENHLLTKYDDEGRRYTYTVTEELENNIQSYLYDISRTGALVNSFNATDNHRTITVHKVWNRNELSTLTANEDQYPVVKFILYQYVQNPDYPNKETNPTWKPLREGQINAQTLKDNAAEATMTFDELPVYNYKGELFGYAIKEVNINGYGEPKYYDEQQGGLYPESSDGFMDVTSDPGIAEGRVLDAHVKVENSYNNPGIIRLSGAKNWNDYGGNSVFGKRPDSISVQLKRYTNSDGDQSNRVPTDNVSLQVLPAEDPSRTDKYIVWRTDESENRWTYTIYNLEQYAANGLPYIYQLHEEGVDQYKKSTPAESRNETLSNQTIVMSNLTNEYNSSYTVRKNWFDGGNKYNLRPENVTIYLERSKVPYDSATDSDWEKIRWNTNMQSLPCADQDAATPYVSINLSAANVMPNTRGNSWRYTFKNIPDTYIDRNPDGTIVSQGRWYYRCVEEKIGGVQIGADNKAGAYVRAYTNQSANGTTISNTLDSTSLKIKKIWENDTYEGEENYYQVRPGKVSFVLQKYQVEEDASSNNEENAAKTDNEHWVNVKKQDGTTDYIFDLTKEDNWEKKLNDLPIVSVEGGTQYYLYFRAKELTVDGTEKEVTDAQSYKDVTTYVADDANNPDIGWDWDETESQNKMKVTNSLVLSDLTISATKQWINDNQNEPAADVTFELQYKPTGTDTWNSYQTPIVKTLTQAEQIAGNTTVSWNHLPKKNAAGEDLEYRIIEKAITGYTAVTDIDDTDPNDIQYTFTNIQTQNYSVEKHWVNESYAAKNDTANAYTATMQLQKKSTGDWENVQNSVVLSSTVQNDTKMHIWRTLPLYEKDGTQIQYRVVETAINGIGINSPACDGTDSDGNYIATYQYGTQTDTLADSVGFKDKKTVITNRMIYGFVNLTKTGGTVSNGEMISTEHPLENVVFDIYQGEVLHPSTADEAYIRGVTTDEHGHLTYTDDGKYGDAAITGNAKYLIPGTYTLVERSTNTGYGLWNTGIVFHIENVTTGIGDRGTAWIYTYTGQESGANVTRAGVENMTAQPGVTTTAQVNTTTGKKYAYNIESRGVLAFTKTAEAEPFVSHTGAAGVSAMYFGVFADEACSQQVAGMKASTDSETDMVLCDTTQNGTILSEQRNGIPYIRKDANGTVYLLSGDYFVKEMIAPAGYQVDPNVHAAHIDEITTTNIDANNIYTSNVGTITGLTADGKWKNTANTLKIYKQDQFGKNVTLKGTTSGYLEIEAPTGVTFATGESVIRLYQDEEHPLHKQDGSVYSADSAIAGAVTYTEASGSWEITGLFDGNDTTVYTLKEPTESVPDAYTQAASLQFKMKQDGKLSVESTTAEAKTAATLLQTTGNDYSNAYATDDNAVLLRDVRRYVDNLTLKKVKYGTTDGIEFISFELYKCNGTDRTVNQATAVLPLNSYLTTNQDGEIHLETSTLENKITGKELQYGLDAGLYFLKEVERGASDQYELRDPIYFTVQADASAPSGAVIEWENTAEGNTIVNKPIVNKTLQLIKTDDTADKNPLAGARFEIVYNSVNGSGSGSASTQTYVCESGADGKLYVVQGDTVTTDLLDISKKGTYTVKEKKTTSRNVSAAETIHYSTVTDADANEIVLLKFELKTDNTFQILESNADYTDGVAVSKLESGIESGIKGVVRNCPTKVKIDKTINTLTGEKLAGASLKIYNGVYDESLFTEADCVYTWDTTTNTQEITGILQEDTLYTLHEAVTPTGYAHADDIYFYIHGTTKADSGISQIYVWDGTGTPSLTASTDWKTNVHKNTDALVMIDEEMYVPINLKKVHDHAGTQTILSDVEFKVTDKASGKELGVAITDDTGYIKWKSLTNDAYESHLVYEENGTLIQRGHRVEKIVLGQNAQGYIIEETQAPAAVHMKQAVTLKITEDNYKEYKANTDKFINIADVSTATSTVSQLTTASETITPFVNTDFEANVQLFKYDAQHENYQTEHHNYDDIGLDGVTFTLYEGSNTDGAGTVYTTKSVTVNGTTYKGFLSIPITKRGTYTLVETQTLDGYQVLSGQSMTFTVTNADYGKILTFDESKENHLQSITAEGMGSVDGNTIEVGSHTQLHDIANTRTHGSLTLEKTDRFNNEPLKGVVYELKKITANNTDTWFVGGTAGVGQTNTVRIETGKKYKQSASLSRATGKNDFTKTENIQELTGSEAGTVIVEDLQWGTYELVEYAALDGYQKLSDVKTFTIDGTNLNQHYTNDTKDTNEKNHIEIRKTAIDATALTGAAFQFYPVTTTGSGATAIKTMQETPAEFYDSRSAASSAVKISEITAGIGHAYGLKAGTYVLAETLAPQGYEISNPLLVTINEAGQITDVTSCTVAADKTVIVNSDTSMFDVSGNVITVKNRPIEIRVHKQDKNSHAELQGTVFKVRGQFANETAEQDITANYDTFETQLKAKLVAGRTYTLTEDTAPNGYAIAASPVTFKVKEDGTITVENEAQVAGFFTYDHSNAVTALTFTDEKIYIGLEKTDENGTLITNLMQDKNGYATFTVRGTFADGSTSKENLTTKIESNSKSVFFNTLEGQLIGGQTYEVEETNVPNGYAKMENVTVTVDKYGKISQVTGNAASVSNNKDILKLKNERTEITFTKKNPKGDDLTGAKFKLTGKFAEDSVNGSVAQQQTKTIEMNTSAAAKLSGEFIIGERYTYEEIQAPKGYELSGSTPLTFTVLDNGSVSFTDTDVFAKRTQDKTIETTDQPVILKLHKTDITEQTKQLAGAEFKVEGTFADNTTRKIVVADADGNLTEKNENAQTTMQAQWIIGQTYSFEEITAPQGYQLRPNDGTIAFAVEVADDGTVRIAGTPTTYVDATADATAQSDVITVFNQPVRTWIKKVGEDQTQTLSGAVFTLTDSCDEAHVHPLANGNNSYEEITTGDDGKIAIPKGLLIVGHTYTLTETKAPVGYGCSAIVSFYVEDNGSISNVRASSTARSAVILARVETTDKTNDTVAISNNRVHQVIEKVDYDNSNTKLQGVSFVIKPAEQSEFTPEYTGVSEDGSVTFVTDEQGKIDIPTELLEPGNDYILTEQSVGNNKGYKLATNEADRSMKFHVEINGNITLATESDTFTVQADSPQKIIVKNDAIAVKIQKVDRDHPGLIKDTKLKLSKKTADTNSWEAVTADTSIACGTDGTWTSSDTDVQMIRKLVPGEYRLEETYAPDGYNIVSEPLYFTVKPNGQVASTDRSGNYSVRNIEDGQIQDVEIDVLNAQFTNLQITKRDADTGDVLRGVEFTFEVRENNTYKYVKLNQPERLQREANAPVQTLITTDAKEEATITTDYNGIISIDSLPDGVYRLTETKAITGYQLLSNPVIIVINRSAESYWQSHTDGSRVRGVFTENTHTFAIEIRNKKGFAIPATGVKEKALPVPALLLTTTLEALLFMGYSRKKKKKTQ